MSLLMSSRACTRTVLGVGLVVALLLALALATPVVATSTETRRYEASSAFVYGDGSSFAFFGTLVCNPYDGVADTGACVPYAGYKGQNVTVSIDDAVLGASTWFIVGIDMDDDRVIRCQQNNGPDVCALAQGSTTLTIPSDASGDTLRVFPATVKASGPFCCPQSVATTGIVTFRFG